MRECPEFFVDNSVIDKDKCSGCKQCLSLGYPAVTFDDENKFAGIDTLSCVDYGLCIQICPFGAISLKERNI
jgi:indolepyruvate ferredoxin oxidoreductase alpha subunit